MAKIKDLDRGVENRGKKREREEERKVWWWGSGGEGSRKKINKAREEETERRDQRGGRRERKLTEQTGRGKKQKSTGLVGGVQRDVEHKSD